MCNKVFSRIILGNIKNPIVMNLTVKKIKLVKKTLFLYKTKNTATRVNHTYEPTTPLSVSTFNLR